MSNAEQIELTVTLTNGEVLKFTFPRQSDPHGAGSLIDEALSKGCLILELGNKIKAIPFQNILHFDISDPPSKLPRWVITNASQV